MKAILLDEAKKWLEENCENQYTRMAVFGIMQSMPTVDYQKTPNEPLTLEQLREMDGQPVYCGDRKEWGIIHIDPDGPWANVPFFRGVYCDLDVQHNGLTLYAYPPAHIDRDCGKDANVPTNADCIRAMSDEELAKAMDMLCPPVTNCIDGEECVKCWTDWLRQPAEED